MSSTEKLPANGRTVIYNEDGQTSIPLDVRRAAGVSEGDTIQWVYEDNVIKAKKI